MTAYECTLPFATVNLQGRFKYMVSLTGARRLAVNDLSVFPFGVGVIAIANVQCTGVERSFRDCPADVVGTSNCNHDYDVGISCGKMFKNCMFSV